MRRGEKGVDYGKGTVNTESQVWTWARQKWDWIIQYKVFTNYGKVVKVKWYGTSLQTELEEGVAFRIYSIVPAVAWYCWQYRWLYDEMEQVVGLDWLRKYDDNKERRGSPYIKSTFVCKCIHLRRIVASILFWNQFFVSGVFKTVGFCSYRLIILTDVYFTIWPETNDSFETTASMFCQRRPQFFVILNASA